MPKFFVTAEVEADSFEDLKEKWTTYEIDPNWEDLYVEREDDNKVGIRYEGENN